MTLPPIKHTLQQFIDHHVLMNILFFRHSDPYGCLLFSIALNAILLMKLIMEWLAEPRKEKKEGRLLTTLCHFSMKFMCRSDLYQRFRKRVLQGGSLAQFTNRKNSKLWITDMKISFSSSSRVTQIFRSRITKNNFLHSRFTGNKIN